jgi:hypothetical protein
VRRVTHQETVPLPLAFLMLCHISVLRYLTSLDLLFFHSSLSPSTIVYRTHALQYLFPIDLPSPPPSLYEVLLLHCLFDSLSCTQSHTQSEMDTKTDTHLILILTIVYICHYSSSPAGRMYGGGI